MPAIGGKRESSSSHLWHAIEARGDRDKRLARLTGALTSLTHRDVLHQGDLDLALRTVTETAAEALEVERVSVWSFSADRARIRCLDRYSRSLKTHSKGDELDVAKSPTYFRQLEAQRIIPAHDARHDPVTSELAGDLLDPFGISSLLEAPVRLGGTLAGVVRHEHVGPARRWRSDEQAFAGSIADLVSLALEAAERRRAEQEAESSRRKLSDFVENANLAMCSLSADGTILWSNRALLDVMGFADDRCTSRNLADFAAAPAQAKELLDRLSADEALKNFAIDLRAADGAVRHVLFNASVLWQEGRFVHARCFVRDVTERRQAETHRRELETQLRQAQKMEAVGRLAGGVAHDFNNILTTIGGYGELVLHQTPEDDPRRPFVQEILLAGERAASLTRQLLAFSRKQVLEPTVIDLDAVVQALVPMLARLIGENIELSVSAGAAPHSIRADRGQIEQVLMNLAANARDAMPEGGTLTLRTSVVTAGAPPEAPAGTCVLLEVADTGVGMGEETRAHLFEPFYTTKEVGRGTGLGLATVYGIVRQSQGQIEVESAPGRGTTFRIWLPATLETAATPTRASVPAAILGEGETILIVEDSDVVRRLAREILQAHGYKVLDAPNGARGLIQAETHRGPIHLLLTDVVMPGISGIECAKRLLQGRPGTRVLYMSGYAEEAVLRQGVLASKTPYLQKPFTPTALALKVAEVLRKISAPPRSDLERFC